MERLGACRGRKETQHSASALPGAAPEPSRRLGYTDERWALVLKAQDRQTDFHILVYGSDLSRLRCASTMIPGSELTNDGFCLGSS